MQYSDIEQKLIRLALDSGAHAGESANAAAMLIKALRKRGVHADQMISNSSSSHSSSSADYYPLYREARAKAIQLESENLRLKSTVSNLETQNLWLKGKLAATTKPVDETPPKPATRSRRPKYGYQALSRRERDLLFRTARRAGKDEEGRSIYGVEQLSDHQIMQRLMKKGYAEKRNGGQRGWHGLTEKGVLYYKQYGHWN